MIKIIVPCPFCLKVNRVAIDKAANAKPICANCKSYLPFHEGLQDVSGSTLNKLLKYAEIPIVVDFWASWCGPCKMFAPVFKATAQQLGDRLVFAKFNTEDDPKGANTYRIQAIPTLIVFKNGAEVDRQSGAMTGSSLSAYLSSFLAKG